MFPVSVSVPTAGENYISLMLPNVRTHRMKYMQFNKLIIILCECSLFLLYIFGDEW